MPAINLRLDDQLHAAAVAAAKADDRSLNGWITRAIREAVLRAAHQAPTGPVARTIERKR